MPKGRDHAGFRLWVCRAVQAHAWNEVLYARIENGVSQGHYQGHRPRSCSGDHRDDGTAGGVHGGSTGGCAGPSVRLGYVKPSSDTSNLDELELGGEHRFHPLAVVICARLAAVKKR